MMYEDDICLLFECATFLANVEFALPYCVGNVRSQAVVITAWITGRS